MTVRLAHFPLRSFLGRRIALHQSHATNREERHVQQNRHFGGFGLHRGRARPADRDPSADGDRGAVGRAKSGHGHGRCVPASAPSRSAGSGQDRGYRFLRGRSGLLRAAPRHQSGRDQRAAARSEDRRSLGGFPAARSGGIREMVWPAPCGGRDAERGDLRADRVLSRRDS